MRYIQFTFSALVLAGSLSAQKPARPTRLGFAVGASWDHTLTGVAGRAEFYPWGSHRTLSWRLEGGARLTPTTATKGPWAAFGADHYEGIQKNTAVSLGISGLIAPFPRGRFSPYLIGGAYVAQEWVRVGRAYLAATGEVVQPYRATTSSLRNFQGLVGAGLRARIGSHDVRVEAQYSHHFTTVTLGGVLPF